MVGAGVYRITHTLDGRVYVGSSIDLQRGLKEHLQRLQRGAHSNVNLQVAWDSSEPALFEFVVLDRQSLTPLPPSPEVFYRLRVEEQRWMDELGAAKTGYNRSPSAHGNAGVKHLPETIEKMKAAIAVSEKRKARALAMVGQRFPDHAYVNARIANTGRKLSPARIEALRVASTGRVPSLETRAKLSAGRTGCKHSEATKEMLSQARLGVSPSLAARAAMSAAGKGRPKSPETRARMAEAARNRSPELLAKIADALHAALALKKSTLKE